MFEGILSSGMEFFSSMGGKQVSDVFWDMIVMGVASIATLFIGYKTSKFVVKKLIVASGRGAISLAKVIMSNGRLFYATSLGSIVLASFGIGASQNGATFGLTPDLSYPTIAAGISGTILSIIASINYAERKKPSSVAKSSSSSTGSGSKA